MDHKRMNEIRDRWLASSCGRWSVHDDGTAVSTNAGTFSSTILYASNLVHVKSLARGNMAFVAHAHQDIPDLLDEIERLQAELAETNRLLQDEAADQYRNPYLVAHCPGCGAVTYMTNNVNILSVFCLLDYASKGYRFGMYDPAPDYEPHKPGCGAPH